MLCGYLTHQLSKNVQFSAVATARVWGRYIVMKTQVTISKKQENKGAKGILDLTSTLGQVLKQFEGLYAKSLPDCDGLTVEGWMSAHGVKRFEKNGKKKGYTPALLMDGWHEGMKQDKVAYVFKNVAAKYFPHPEDVEKLGLPDFETACRVFTKEEAEKIDGKPISRYMLKAVPENKWSVNTILKGLKQGNNFEKENEKMMLSDLEWENLEEVYIVWYAKGENGEVSRIVTPINKDFVQF